uniref:Uncharacterized protein n=1 Tax=Arundo donax TaxID=35708 RepID=A0A0A9A6Y4_ARUDO
MPWPQSKFTGALIPAFFPELEKQDNSDELYMQQNISPFLPPQLTSLFLPSTHQLRRNGALQEARADFLFLRK